VLGLSKENGGAAETLTVDEPAEETAETPA
jgi:hypothetical protein